MAQGSFAIITTICPARVGTVSPFYTGTLESAAGSPLQPLIKLNSMCILTRDTVRRQRKFESILGETKSPKDYGIHLPYSFLGRLET